VAKVHKGCTTIDNHLCRNAYRVLVGKLKGRRLLGIPRHRWKDNIKLNFGEIDWSHIDWIDLV
jgi:hypothetical protein